jgi:hypothetical protein
MCQCHTGGVNPSCRGRGKYPGAPPHHEKMRNQADRKRYLIGLLGERGKAKKKNAIVTCQQQSTNEDNI